MQKMKRNPAPHVLQATFSDGEPVRPRREMDEVFPHHADMLRYDLGFHSPDDTSLVIFPAFRHKTQGDYPDITPARWRSFGITLAIKDEGDWESFDYIATHPIGDWIGYRHNDNYTRLIPVTLNDWLKDHPKVVINGWRGAYHYARAAGR